MLRDEEGRRDVVVVLIFALGAWPVFDWRIQQADASSAAPDDDWLHQSRG
jgi:hypothetical protein